MRNRNDIMGIFWIFLAVIVALVVAGVTLSLLYGSRYGAGAGYGYGMMGGGTGMWVFGGLFMIIPIVLFLLFIYWIVEIASGHNHDHRYDDAYRPGNSAIEALDVRYAKGEITKDQYDAMKKDIQRQ